jgi:hypothetical protein
LPRSFKLDDPGGRILAFACAAHKAGPAGVMNENNRDPTPA